MVRGRRSSGRFGIAILVATVVLSACGSNKNETQQGSDGSSDKVVKIGLVAPLSGKLTALGVGMRNSVDLAVRQANDAKKIKGWKIVFQAEDDTGVPDVGAAAATKLSDDKALLGVVGPLNSSVGEKVAPILNNQKIVLISPANTNPTLTQGNDPNNKVRPYEYYFRVATTDLIQGPFAANFVSQTAMKKNVVVIHDKKTYGQGLALQFKAQFEKNGGKVPAVETVEPDDVDFSAVLSRIKRFNPDMIYFGGEYPAASLLTSQADQQGIKAPLMGGDGIFDQTYIDVAKQAGEGDFATSVGAPTDKLPTAQAFVDAYKAAGYAEPYSAYGAYSYDAANAIIEALAKVLPGQNKIDDTLKPKVRQAVQDGSFDGVTGKVAFDQYGDTTTRILTVYKVEGGAWKPQKTEEFK
ncbi:MAG TPA: branched-chain amino acid ABC transporter substrate-binding protein [Acidimicrobiia bacterium]|jgi:branched-chain amino acid transport system substrate-binding protein|nr:branched-chain amino acid ABC transporter substrate-binding protein [Acidimicrobiia bacterium]